ncbi:unnamed protein product [Spirodela intermedia]|uniref:Uncharacterized protein n=2 Tax=Spirodela intermedia TaxID=51605 RepID=A0A7I8IWE7_SPIIN|nr:unnamed protein product [Spirodela intermedia]CAA6662307.1 unnamed protein product [Spirodela intermedia]CAA7398705.1 unnamed protein product [Spirodela intermedia]
MVPAPTVRTHGGALDMLLGRGPPLPAEETTRTPAMVARKVATERASRWYAGTGEDDPNDMERMSTPSATALSIAATMSETRQPAGQQTL